MSLKLHWEARWRNNAFSDRFCGHLGPFGKPLGDRLAPRWPLEGPKASRSGAKNRAKSTQEAPKTAQEAPKTAQEAPKARPRALKRLPTATERPPRGHPDLLRGSQEALKSELFWHHFLDRFWGRFWCVFEVFMLLSGLLFFLPFAGWE